MSLFKRGSTWWIDFTTASGERVRCSARTEDRTQAQEFHDKVKAESWRVVQLGEKADRTWDEAALRWIAETSHNRSHHLDLLKIEWLQQYFSGRCLSEIMRDVISKTAEIKLKETSATSANRVLALIRSILRRAVLEWEWIDKCPRIRLYPELKGRVRWITPEQVQTLLATLPTHLADMVRFSLATGFRQSNVTHLEWAQVDQGRGVAWIYADQAKGKKDIHVTLNATAQAVLLGQIGKHPTRVFTYRGRPVNQVNTKAWHLALKRAGLENFRWHDLRHTWASWLTQKGVPLNVIQEMGAWGSAEMVRRYAHLAPEQFARHAKVIDDLLGDTVTTQQKQNGQESHS